MKWTYNESLGMVLDEDGGTVCDLLTGLDEDPSFTANGRLLAAAPDLLAALELIMYQYSSVHLQLPAADVKIMRAAIDRAKLGEKRT